MLYPIVKYINLWNYSYYFKLLEFLGDAILEYILVYQLCTQKNIILSNTQLHKIRVSYLNNKYLSNIGCQIINFFKFIDLNRLPESNVIINLNTIIDITDIQIIFDQKYLANIFEAFIGFLILDSNFSSVIVSFIYHLINNIIDFSVIE